jgi:hypothetical protein
MSDPTANVTGDSTLPGPGDAQAAGPVAPASPASPDPWQQRYSGLYEKIFTPKGAGYPKMEAIPTYDQWVAAQAAQQQLANVQSQATAAQQTLQSLQTDLGVAQSKAQEAEMLSRKLDLISETGDAGLLGFHKFIPTVADPAQQKTLIEQFKTQLDARAGSTGARSTMGTMPAGAPPVNGGASFVDQINALEDQIWDAIQKDDYATANKLRTDLYNVKGQYYKATGQPDPGLIENYIPTGGRPK